MADQPSLRDEFLATLDHIKAVAAKVRKNTGAKGIFAFPDQYKLADGLFLSAWTHWEEFLRALMIEDLAEDPKGVVRKRVKAFRSSRAAHYLSEHLLDHPDPARYVDWSSVKDIVDRAQQFLAPGHRFQKLASCQSDLEKLKRIRNAIAHKGDRAWDSFRTLVQSAPFSLKPNQMKGITTGRFLAAHTWNGSTVLEHSITVLENAAKELVP